MKTKLILIPSIIALILSSCTIQKRLYRPGYNIEWNKVRTSNIVVQPSSDTKSHTNYFLNLRDGSPEIKMAYKKNVNPQIERPDLKGPKTVTANSWSEVKSLQDTPSKLSLKTEKYFFKEIKSKGSKRPSKSGGDQELDGYAVLGFILGLVSFLLILVFIASADSFAPFFFVMLLELLSIILSSIAISRIAKEGSKYTGMGLAICGISFSAVPFVIILLLYLLIYQLNIGN